MTGVALLGVVWLLVPLAGAVSSRTATHDTGWTPPAGQETIPPVIRGAAGRRMHELAKRAAVFGFSGQVLVAADDRIVLHRAYGFADARDRRPMTTETGVGVASISKQFLGAAVLELAEAARLRLEDSLPAFFDDLPEAKRGITLAQLLAHTSGVRSRYAEDFEPATRDELIRGILETELAFKPGTRWRYSAAGYNLAAAIIERVTGERYRDYVHRTLLEPAGMRHTGLADDDWEPDEVARSYLGWEDRGSPAEWPPNWRNFGAGDLVSTAADLYRWERALRSGAVLSAASLDRYFRPLAVIDEDVDYGFGLFFHTDEEGRRVIEHGGDAALGFNGSFYRYPDEDFLILITCNARTPVGNWLRHALGEGLEAIVRGGEAESAPAAELPSEEALRTLTGTYRLEDGSRLHALTDGSHLWLAAAGQEAVNRLGGYDDETVAALERGNRKTARLFAGLLRADSSVYREALTEEGAPYFDDYWNEWRGLVEARGPLHAYDLLGSSPGRGSVTSRVRLQFRTGALTMTLFWGDQASGRLRGTFIEGVPFRPPVALAVGRVAGDEFVAHELLSGRTLAVELEPSGALRISDEEGSVRAEPMGLAGWTPPF